MPTDPREPSRRATDRSTRRARFVMPDDRHDERTSERIEAFLAGPPRRRSRSRHARAESPIRPRRVVPLDTRSDWNTALHHEDARVVRYGRPAAVLIVDIGSRQPGRIDRIAEQVGSTVRHQARETDRVARVSPSRFHVLLPETHAADADALAERVRRACAEITVAPAGLGVIVQIASASPSLGETLGDALRDAERRLAS